MPAPPRPEAPALARGIAIVELLANAPRGLRTETLAEALGIPRSSAFVLVRTLSSLGWVEQDGDGHSHLAPRLLSLAAGAVRSQDLPRAAGPHLRELRDALGLTVHLAVPTHDGGVVYVDKADGPGIVRFDTYVGKRADAHLTAVGKALLAYADPADLERILRHRDLRGGTDRSARSAPEVHAQLDRTRARGWAYEDQEEVEGVRCVAAAITADGRAIAAVGCIGLVSDLPDDRIEPSADAVVHCARTISRRLGARSEGQP